jgi:hypothetical protein
MMLCSAGPGWELEPVRSCEIAQSATLDADLGFGPTGGRGRENTMKVSRDPGSPPEPVHPDPANPTENPRPGPDPSPDPEIMPPANPEIPPEPAVPGVPPQHPLGPPEPQP